MIQSVQRATRILSVLAEHYGEPITLTCLARRAQLNSATCAHIVATLEAEGYVIKLSRTRGYVLGPEAYCLSRFGRYKNDLITQCHPVMEYLHKMTGYTVILAVIDGETKYIIDYIDNGEIFETKAQIRQDDIYRTATGRAILANLSADKVFDVFAKYGKPGTQWPEVQSFEKMNRYCATVKKDGVFKNRNENDTGWVYLGYGAALMKHGHCVGALGVAVKCTREQEIPFLQEKERLIMALLERAVQQLNRRLQEN